MGEFVFAVAVVLGGLGFIVYNSFFAPSVKVPRLLAKARATPIREAKHGLVKIVGKVRAANELRAGFTNRPSVGWECAVYVKVGDGQTRLVAREVQLRDFLVEDDTGTARVEVEGARLALSWDAGSSKEGPLPEVVSEFLVRRGYLDHIGGTETILFYQGVVEANCRIAVAGLVELEPDLSPNAAAVSYREAPMRPVLRAGPGGILISNKEEAF